MQWILVVSEFNVNWDKEKSKAPPSAGRQKNYSWTQEQWVIGVYTAYI